MNCGNSQDGKAKGSFENKALSSDNSLKDMTRDDRAQSRGESFSSPELLIQNSNSVTGRRKANQVNPALLGQASQPIKPNDGIQTPK